MDGEEFLRRMRAGDDRVWHELMPALRVTVLGACRALNVFDSVKEDIVQDVAERVFLKWQSCRGDSKVTTWIYEIARNRCLDELRRRKVRGDHLVHEPADADAAEAAAGSHRPDHEQSLCVQQVLAELEAQPEARKGSMRMIEVLAWWVENSPTTEELAGFLQTTLAAAKERKSYILRQLKALCRKYCGHDECALVGGA